MKWWGGLAKSYCNSKSNFVFCTAIRFRLSWHTSYFEVRRIPFRQRCLCSAAILNPKVDRTRSPLPTSFPSIHFFSIYCVNDRINRFRWNTLPASLLSLRRIDAVRSNCWFCRPDSECRKFLVLAGSKQLCKHRFICTWETDVGCRNLKSSKKSGRKQNECRLVRRSKGDVWESQKLHDEKALEFWVTRLVGIVLSLIVYDIDDVTSLS
jgi:hypothetical protein